MIKTIAKAISQTRSRISHRNTFAHLHKEEMAHLDSLYPKIFSVFHGNYSVNDLLKDIIAGITVGIVAMPLAMAFAIGSGVTPLQGLYTAIIAGILIGFLGGSRFQVSGPTGAFVIIIYGIVYRHGYDGLVITTFMAGGILALAGFFRLGSIIKYIPYPVTTGFTAGIALTIFSSQMGDFFGLSLQQVPPDFLSKWALYFSQLSNLHPATFGVALGTLILMFLIRFYLPRVPAPVVGVLVGGLIVWGFGLPVETISARYGEIPAALPTFQPIDFSLERIIALFPDAITIAILAGLESLLTCVVADSMTGDRHFSNMELIAQGTGNIACALFGGIPATGAIARTATNISSGAKSPVSAIIHGFTVLAFVLWLSPLTSAIPLACLAAVMVITSYGMLEINAIKNILRGPKSDWSVMLLTFFLTVLVDLTVAVYVGVLLASLLFMRRMSVMSSIEALDENDVVHDYDESLVNQEDLPKGVFVYSISGPFFFGMVDRFQNMFMRRNPDIKVYILYMRDVPAIDATGIHVLESFLSHRKSHDFHVIIANPPVKTRRILKKMGIMDALGENNICHSLKAAIIRAEHLIKNEENKK